MLRALIIILLCSYTLQAQTIKTQIASTQLLPGEVTVMSLIVSGITLQAPPKIPSTEGLRVEHSGTSSNSNISFFGRNTNQVSKKTYSYQVTALREGNYKIPSIGLAEKDLKTPEIPIQVHPADTSKVIWREGKIRNFSYTYGLATFIPHDQPFVGQSMTAELKIYLSSSLRFNANNLPEVSMDGMNAHRFDPERITGAYSTDSTRYNVISYGSITSALKSGPVTLGPSSIEIPIAPNNYNVSNVLKANFPLLTLTARDLPSGAPKNFGGAIGQFEMVGEIDLDNAEAGGPFSINLTISGNGNLDVIKAPELENEKDWKMYPPRRVDGEDIRHEGRGSVIFDLLLRPTRKVSEIPPFLFSYFDPITEKYETLVSEKNQLPENLQELPQQPGSAVGISGPVIPPAAVDQPIEEMIQTLGVIDPLRNPRAAVWPPHTSDNHISLWWHLIPITLILAMIIPIFLRHQRARRASQTRLLPQQKTLLQTLQSSNLAAPDFYRQVGNFIESTPKLNNQSEFQSILEKRDELCFLQESPDIAMPEDEKKTILETLKKSLLSSHLILIILALLSFHSSGGAAPFVSIEKEFLSGNYDKVVDLYKKQSEEGNFTADELYNIGTAYARAGKTGQAALHFRRALVLDPHHPESQQNLRFLERKTGSLTAERAGWAEKLTFFPKNFYLILGQTSLWIFVGSITFALCYRKMLGLTAIIAILFTICAIIAFLSAAYYPDYGDFRARASQGIVLTDDTIARTDPTQTAQTIIQTPPGSLCQILSKRGTWSYCEFPNGTRGWLDSDSISPILPRSEEK